MSSPSSSLIRNAIIVVVALALAVWLSAKYGGFPFISGISQQAAVVQAGSLPITGWGWSGGAANGGPYMGWMSMENVGEDPTTGALSGYAWSSNLGWVSFNAADVAGCPFGTCAPKINLTTQKAVGWARACAAFANKSACSGALESGSGGWDGWISLGTQSTETVAYGIQQRPDCTWSGYAWGSANIGWIDFSGAHGPANHPACTAPGVDLTMGEIAPDIAAAGIPQKFTATVTNGGSVSTGISFYNLLQKTSSTDGQGVANAAVIDINTVSSGGALAGGSSAVLTYTYTFPSADAGTVQYLRFCADKSAAAGDTGSITEVNEQNNCGPWKVLAVILPPNLTAGAVTPATATAGTVQTYSVDIINSGTGIVPLNRPFYNSVQRTATVVNGVATSPIVDATNASLSGGVAANGAVKKLTFTYTFPVADAGAIRYLRVCADDSSVNTDTSDIPESNETDNCGAWTAIDLGLHPNLTIDNVSQRTVPVNTQVYFSTTVHNSGAAPTTNATFYNLLQRTDAVDALGNPTGVVTNLIPPPTLSPSPKAYIGTIAAGGSGPLSFNPYSFPTADGGQTRYIRACADKSSGTSAGAVDEGSAANEGDNCSGWQAIQVTIAATQPNLQAGDAAASPSSVSTTESTTLSGTANNIGDGDAASFPSVYRIKNSAGTIIKYVSAGSVAIPHQTSGVALASPTHTFATEGTYSIDICVNMDTSGTVPVIAESNSLDNCGNPASVTVGTNNPPQNCSNGATNYPACNTCTAPNIYSNGQCVPPPSCSNGATNYPTCTTCTAPATMVNGVCTNPPGTTPTATIRAEEIKVPLSQSTILHWTSSNVSSCDIKKTIEVKDSPGVYHEVTTTLYSGLTGARLNSSDTTGPIYEKSQFKISCTGTTSGTATAAVIVDLNSSVIEI